MTRREMDTTQMNRVGRRGGGSAFVVMVLLSVLVSVVALVALILTWSPNRPVLPVLVLAALFLVAEHRDRVFTDETGMSGSISVGLCAAMFLGATGWFQAAFFVCGAGALYLPHIRARSWTKIALNFGCFGVSGSVAALLVDAIQSRAVASPDRALVLAVVFATAAYWLCNSLILAIATASLSRERLAVVAWELVRSESVMLVFAVGGALCGLVMVEVGQWTGIAALVAVLVALDVFVISVPAGPATLRSAWRMLISRVAGAAMGGVVGAALPKLVASAVVGAMLGGVVGLAAGLATVALVALVRLRRSRTRLEPSVLFGFIVAEITLPAIGTIGGVVGAFAGWGPAIATSAGLVVIASMCALWLRRASSEEPIDDDLLLAAVTEAMFDGLPHPANRE